MKKEREKFWIILGLFGPKKKINYFLCVFFCICHFFFVILQRKMI